MIRLHTQHIVQKKSQAKEENVRRIVDNFCGNLGLIAKQGEIKSYVVYFDTQFHSFRSNVDVTKRTPWSRWNPSMWRQRGVRGKVKFKCFILRAI